uniref:HdeD family acid-resistance protein n=1 Tax=Solibacter usitatus (strain Ellin6076) TaxID=234267 RepID=Q01UB8_SOLUE
MSIESSSLGTARFFGRNWWVLLLRGLLAIVLGALVFTKPFWSLGAIVLAFGVYALIEGASALLAAIFGWRHRDDRWLLLLEGLIGICVGAVTLRTPAVTAMLMIFFIAIWALATGVLRIVEGVRLRREIPGEVWLVLGGVASVIFAVIIMMRPLAGAIAMVRVIAAYALILGATEVLLAFRVRGAREGGRPRVSEPSYRRVA